MPEIRGDENGDRLVVSTKEIWEGRTGGIDEFGNRHYTRCWNVLVTNVNADALEVTASGALPALFSYYQSPNGATDVGATLRRYECQQLPEGVQWRVTAYYDSTATQTPLGYNPWSYGDLGGFNTGNVLEQDPILRPPEIQWGSLRVQRHIQKDLDGKPTTASNGQRLDPPIMRDLTVKVLSISRNETVAVYNPINLMAFENTVNSTQWIMTHPLLSVSIGPRLAKCETITAQTQSEQKKHFWRVNYVFHINPNKKSDGTFEEWKSEPLDVGTYQWAIGTGLVLDRKQITDKSGMPVTSPVPLDNNGKELPTLTNTFPPQFDYKYRSFKVYEEKNFNSLFLP